MRGQHTRLSHRWRLNFQLRTFGAAAGMQRIASRLSEDPSYIAAFGRSDELRQVFCVCACVCPLVCKYICARTLPCCWRRVFVCCRGQQQSALGFSCLNPPEVARVVAAARIGSLEVMIWGGGAWSHGCKKMSDTRVTRLFHATSTCLNFESVIKQVLRQLCKSENNMASTHITKCDA